MSNPELKWLPLEPTPLELEWIERQRVFYEQLFTMFRLTPEEIGTVQDVNRAASESQQAAYRKRLRR